MSIVFPSQNIFTRISDYFSNRPIGRMPKTPKSTQTRPTPITMRSLKQQLDDGGSAPIEKKAFESPPFSARFALLVFSIRLKFTGSVTSLEALKTDMAAFKKSLKDAGLSSTVQALATIQSTIETRLNSGLAIPLAGGPGFRY